MTEVQKYRQDKNNMPPIFDLGGIKTKEYFWLRRLYGSKHYRNNYFNLSLRRKINYFSCYAWMGWKYVTYMFKLSQLIHRKRKQSLNINL